MAKGGTDSSSIPSRPPGSPKGPGSKGGGNTDSSSIPAHPKGTGRGSSGKTPKAPAQKGMKTPVMKETKDKPPTVGKGPK
jgi:hypothetical protein